MSKNSETHRLLWFAIGNVTMYALTKWSLGLASRAGIRTKFSEEDVRKIRDQLYKEWHLK